jgi:AraC-like DNA-binding protein
LFDDSFRLRFGHAAIWLSVVAFSFANCALLAPSGGSERLAVIAINLLVLSFIALAVVQTVSSWSADLVEGRRHVRLFIVIAAALYGGFNAILHLVITDGGTAEIASAINAALLAAIVAAICLAMLRVGSAEVFTATLAEREPEPRPDTSAADQKVIDALMRLMADERIYRHENVTIGTLATKLSVPEYRLRRLINQKLGYRNFNVFLNNHRIEEAKTALADPAQAEVPVITIAMDAGFASLGPFNRAFKATTGLTPTEYRRRRGIAA